MPSGSGPLVRVDVAGRRGAVERHLDALLDRLIAAGVGRQREGREAAALDGDRDDRAAALLRRDLDGRRRGGGRDVRGARGVHLGRRADPGDAQVGQRHGLVARLRLHVQLVGVGVVQRRAGHVIGHLDVLDRLRDVRAVDHVDLVRQRALHVEVREVAALLGRQRRDLEAAAAAHDRVLGHDVLGGLGLGHDIDLRLRAGTGGERVARPGDLDPTAGGLLAQDAEQVGVDAVLRRVGVKPRARVRVARTADVRALDLHEVLTERAAGDRMRDRRVAEVVGGLVGVPLQERTDLALEQTTEVPRPHADVVGDEDRCVIARDERVDAVRVGDLVLGPGHEAAADAVARAAEHGLRVAAAVGALDRVEREDVVAAVGGQRGLAREVEELVREVVREADLGVRVRRRGRRVAVRIEVRQARLDLDAVGVPIPVREPVDRVDRTELHDTAGGLIAALEPLARRAGDGDGR